MADLLYLANIGASLLGVAGLALYAWQALGR
jgi:hypothetical protein